MWEIGQMSSRLVEEMKAAYKSKDPLRIRRAEEARAKFDAEFKPTPFRSDQIGTLEERVSRIEKQLDIAVV